MKRPTNNGWEYPGLCWKRLGGRCWVCRLCSLAAGVKFRISAASPAIAAFWRKAVVAPSTRFDPERPVAKLVRQVNGRLKLTIAIVKQRSCSRCRRSRWDNAPQDSTLTLRPTALLVRLSFQRRRFAAARFLWQHERQRKPENGPFRSIGVASDFAAVALDDCFAEGQANPHAE